MPPLTSRTLARLRAARQAVDAGGGGEPVPPVPPVERDLEVRAPVQRVWAALTDPATIAAWLTCQDVAFDACPGGAFRLFDGTATGTVTRAVPPRLLEYRWQMDGWPEGAPPSLVRWELTPAAGGTRTRLRLRHTGFPDRATRDAHDAGWSASFLDKLLPWLTR